MQIKSLKKKNAIVFQFLDLAEFLSDLRLCCDMNGSTTFKLTQSASEDGQQKRQFIEMTQTEAG